MCVCLACASGEHKLISTKLPRPHFGRAASLSLCDTHKHTHTHARAGARETPKIQLGAAPMKVAAHGGIIKDGRPLIMPNAKWLNATLRAAGRPRRRADSRPGRLSSTRPSLLSLEKGLEPTATVGATDANAAPPLINTNEFAPAATSPFLRQSSGPAGPHRTALPGGGRPRETTGASRDRRDATDDSRRRSAEANHHRRISSLESDS